MGKMGLSERKTTSSSVGGVSSPPRRRTIPRICPLLIFAESTPPSWDVRASTRRQAWKVLVGGSRGGCKGIQV